MTDSGVDPFLLLSQDEETWGEIDGSDLLSSAARRFDPARPGPLASLLTADNPLIRRRGLFVFGELGRKAQTLLDLALRSVDDPDGAARAALMNGVISYSESLSAEQALTVLGLANDPDELVRSRVVAFIRESHIDVLRLAIRRMAPEAASEHSRGLNRVAAPDRSPQALLDEGVSTTGLRSTYALAAVERMARDGLIQVAPTCVDGSWIGESTRGQILRLMRRWERLAGPHPRSV